MMDGDDTTGIRRICIPLTCTAIGAALLLGCGDTSDAAVDDEYATVSESPPEIMLNGRRYVKLSLLSESERAELENPALWEQPETVEKLEQLLRAIVSHHQYGDYIEAAPNRELARISLGLDPSPRGLRDDVAPDGAPRSFVRSRQMATSGSLRRMAAATRTTRTRSVNRAVPVRWSIGAFTRRDTSSSTTPRSLERTGGHVGTTPRRRLVRTPRARARVILAGASGAESRRPEASRLSPGQRRGRSADINRFLAGGGTCPATLRARPPLAGTMGFRISTAASSPVREALAGGYPIRPRCGRGSSTAVVTPC